MSRAASLAKLESAVGALTDEQIDAVADFASSIAELLDFRFSAEERAAIGRSFEDFENGRTLTLDEAEARTIAFLAEQARRA